MHLAASGTAPMAPTPTATHLVTGAKSTHIDQWATGGLPTDIDNSPHPHTQPQASWKGWQTARRSDGQTERIPATPPRPRCLPATTTTLNALFDRTAGRAP